MSELTLQPSSHIYHGLAGTGKSTKLLNDAINAIVEGKNILHLSFNEEIRWDIIRKQPSLKEYVHMFHSLVNPSIVFYEEIRKDIHKFNNYKHKFKEVIPKDLKEYFNKKELYLNLPIDYRHCETIWWLGDSEIYSYRNLDYIFVDDLQDFDEEMIRMLKIIFNRNKGVKIIAAGDPLQNIFPNLSPNDIYNNFEMFQIWFGSASVTGLELNYRSSASIQKFINGYYVNQYLTNRNYNLKNYTSEQYTDDVFIHCIQNEEEIDNVIKDILNFYPDKKIAILGKVCKDLDSKELLDLVDERIHVSPIYFYKEECDVVILVNTYNDEINTIGEKNTINRIITRAKEKLHIVTSIPQERILSIFKEGTYIIIN